MEWDTSDLGAEDTCFGGQELIQEEKIVLLLLSLGLFYRKNKDSLKKDYEYMYIYVHRLHNSNCARISVVLYNL